MKNKNLIKSLNNAINGIAYTIKNERNMKIHIVAAVGVFTASFFFKLTKVEFLIICITVMAVLVSEMFNTAIEVFIDMFVEVYHPKVKIVKDVAAGAVWISAISALIVGYTVFFDKIKELVIR